MRVVIRFCRIDIKIVISDFSVVQGKKGTRSSGWKEMEENGEAVFIRVFSFFSFFFFFSNEVYLLSSH